MKKLTLGSFKKQEKNYNQIYDEFWKEIIEEKDGKLDIEQIKKELADYSFMLHEVPKVYCEVSGNRISKPNTYAFEVIGQFNELNLNKDITQDDVQEMIKYSKTLEELKEELKDYFELSSQRN